MDESSATGELARRETSCVRRWGLRLGPMLAGGYRSHVRDRVTAGGHPVVLKLTRTIDEANLEARALTVWRDTGAAVRLYLIYLTRLPFGRLPATAPQSYKQLSIRYLLCL